MILMIKSDYKETLLTVSYNQSAEEVSFVSGSGEPGAGSPVGMH
jgi:hypothetical protein